MLYNYIYVYEMMAYKIMTMQYHPKETNELVFYLRHPSSRMPDVRVWVSKMTVTIPYYRIELYVGHSVLHTGPSYHLIKESRDYIDRKFVEIAQGFYKCISAKNAMTEISMPSDVPMTGLII